MSHHKLTADLVQQIRTPLLILDPLDDHLLGGQPQALVDHLLDSQEYTHVQPEKQHGAGLHCQVGAVCESDRVMYGWLAKVIGVQKNRPLAE